MSFILKPTIQFNSTKYHHLFLFDFQVMPIIWNNNGGHHSGEQPRPRGWVQKENTFLLPDVSSINSSQFVDHLWKLENIVLLIQIQLIQEEEECLHLQIIVLFYQEGPICITQPFHGDWGPYQRWVVFMYSSLYVSSVLSRVIIYTQGWLDYRIHK